MYKWAAMIETVQESQGEDEGTPTIIQHTATVPAAPDTIQVTAMSEITAAPADVPSHPNTPDLPGGLNHRVDMQANMPRTAIEHVDLVARHSRGRQATELDEKQTTQSWTASSTTPADHPR